MSILSADQEYREGFDFLSKHTDEYKKLKNLILKQVVPYLSSTDTFLDVGAGRGNLTLALSAIFKHIYIVEPNRIYCEEVAKKIRNTGKKVTAFDASWSDIDLPENAFDLVLCVHVLYYVDPEEWVEFLSKLIRRLTPGGKLILVSVSKMSNICELYRTFLNPSQFESIPYSEIIIDLLSLSQHKIETIELESSISVSSSDDFWKIVSFLVSQSKEQIRRKHHKVMLPIEAQFQTKNGYCITNLEHTIIVNAAD